jgi:phosphoribosylaminoimidazole carboxylase PurE protein
MNAQVLILMGSDSDLPTMIPAVEMLKKFDIPFEITVSSAHRSPERTKDLIRQAEAGGVKVIICAAGGAAHLGGVVAAETTLPVIGVPIDASSLQGLDALLATVQMPPGIPVATVSIGKWGAANAAILATQIIALSDEAARRKLEQHKADMAAGVEEKAERLKKKLAE